MKIKLVSDLHLEFSDINIKNDQNYDVLILGGERDPVGGANGLGRLADAYRQSGHVDVTLTLYEGGRHEMLNEINRDAVTADIIAWIRQKRVRAL